MAFYLRFGMEGDVSSSQIRNKIIGVTRKDVRRRGPLYILLYLLI